LARLLCTQLLEEEKGEKEKRIWDVIATGCHCFLALF
jgi:hypothetical protein